MLIDQAAKLLLESQYTVALTGAGISTSSGIPDFRSSDKGLWQQYDPMEVASLSAFRTRPERFFAWFRPLAENIIRAVPNPAHIALAQLESAGYLKVVITQNIDGLHQKAGSKQVLEVHGTLNTLTCVQCYSKYPTSNFVTQYLEAGEIPKCPKCGGILKPDAILFEEQLPIKTWQAVEQAMRQCDLMIVAGSSLEVIPVARLPYQTVNKGGKLILINNQPTYIDSRADVVLHEDLAIALPAVVQTMLNGKSI